MATDVNVTGDGLSALQTIADNGAPLGPGGGVAMEGTSGSAVADDGSDPVKIGLVYNSTPPSLANGQRVDAQADVRGNIKVILADPSGPSSAMTLGNIGGTALSSSARTASTDSGDKTNRGGRAMHCVVNVTAATGSPSVVVTIEGKDTVSGVYYTLLQSAAITGTGTTVLRIGPGLTASPNLTAVDIVPPTFRITTTHANTDSITYSIGYTVV